MAYAQELLQRAERAFAAVTVHEAYQSRRAIVGPTNMPPGAQANLAQQALQTLRTGGVPSPKQLAALELMVRLMRPSLLSAGATLEDLPPEAAGTFPGWNDFRGRVKPSLYTVGRVDGAGGDGVGTGFLVSATLLVTNAHVLDVLSNGTRVLERGQASVRFKREFNVVPDEAAFAVVRVVEVHATLDLALLEVDPVPLSDTRKPLAVAAADAAVGDPVAVLGYPLNDSERNPLFIAGIFGNRFGVKRGAPGEVVRATTGAIFHDASTLGGNSGSPVVSMRTGEVVGVHRVGQFMFRNESVPGSQLGAFVQHYLAG